MPQRAPGTVDVQSVDRSFLLRRHIEDQTLSALHAGGGPDLGERGRGNVHGMHSRSRTGRPPGRDRNDVPVQRRLGALTGAPFCPAGFHSTAEVNPAKIGLAKLSSSLPAVHD